MKKILIAIGLLVSAWKVQGQDLPGFNTGNYAGVSGIDYNPASIADSRFKGDWNFIGFSVAAGNNYMGLKRSALKYNGLDFGDTTRYPAFQDPEIRDYLIENYKTGKSKSAYANFQLITPFSFMSSINEKSSFAITLRERFFVSATGIPEEIAHAIYKETKDTLQYVNILGSLKDQDINVTAMLWGELGVTYARVIYDNGYHFIKGGIRPKLLQGHASAYMDIKNFSYHFDAKDTMTILNSDVSYGHSANLTYCDTCKFENLEWGSREQIYRSGQDFGGGLDFGFVYEWRPKYEDYRDLTDIHNIHYRRDQNKYRVRLGVAVSDIGKIRFKKGDYSHNFKANVNQWDISNLEPKNIYDFDDTLKKRFNILPDNDEYYWVNLPTTVSIQADFHVWKGFYINHTQLYAIPFKKKVAKVSEKTTFSLTPRLEGKYLGLYIPMSYNTNGNSQIGTAVRLGPLVLGTSNITPFIDKGKDWFNFDFFFLLKASIPYNKPERVTEIYLSHVPPPMEEIPDEEPDRDNDKIPDYKDECPDIPGLKIFNGCPDKDGDMIPDHKDDCPDVAGLKEFNGCPDKDGDGLPDHKDACPEIPGPKEYNGCPDRDGDRVLDKDDRCPDVPGAIDNQGCPWPDADKDGVYDREDECPNTPGPKENKGCPVIKKEEQEILERAFSNLEFATGKDIIKKESFPSLNELAELLVKHSKDGWILKLSGHTDNQGTADKNLILSKKRTIAVQKYLQRKGVKTKINTEWFGQTKPVASNDTPEGRQRNRRVEMKVLFK